MACCGVAVAVKGIVVLRQCCVTALCSQSNGCNLPKTPVVASRLVFRGAPVCVVFIVALHYILGAVRIQPAVFTVFTV